MTTTQLIKFPMNAAIEMKAQGNFPKIVHPQIGDVMGSFNGITLSKSIVVTEFNQVEFTAPYELEEGEMEILNLISSGKALEVNSSQMWSNKDGQTTVVANVSFEIEAEDEEQTYELANKYLAKLNISGFDYMDHVQGKVYSCEVKSMNYELSELVY